MEISILSSSSRYRQNYSVMIEEADSHSLAFAILNNEKNFSGSPAMRKSTSSFDLMAMMADKRKELQLREEAACVAAAHAAALMLPHRPGPPGAIMESPSGQQPHGYPGFLPTSPANAGTFTFPGGGALFPPGKFN